jgi:hypothetical protein
MLHSVVDEEPRAAAREGPERITYAERSALLVTALRERGIEPGIAPDGLNVWIETRAQADALAARGWRVRPAGAFAVGDAARAVRVTTSTITLERAAAFAADLAEAR